MRSRAYSKRIQVWQTTDADDGYGGNTVTETLLNTSWASIKTISPSRLTDYGITETTHALDVRLRQRYDLDYEQEGIFLKYKDESYIISSVLPVDLEMVEVRIVAVKL